MRAGLKLVVGDVARFVRCGVGAPFQATASGRRSGFSGDSLGYRAAFITTCARGRLRGRGAHLPVTAKSTAFNAVDLGRGYGCARLGE